MAVATVQRPPQVQAQWNRLTALDNADIFFESSTWPAKFRKLFVKPTLSSSQWFALFVFLWQNGMQPELALKWSTQGKTLDPHCRREANHILQRIASAPGSFDKVRFVDLTRGTVAPAHVPPGSGSQEREEAHGYQIRGAQLI